MNHFEWLFAGIKSPAISTPPTVCKIPTLNIFWRERRNVIECVCVCEWWCTKQRVRLNPCSLKISLMAAEENCWSLIRAPEYEYVCEPNKLLLPHGSPPQPPPHDWPIAHAVKVCEIVNMTFDVREKRREREKRSIHIILRINIYNIQYTFPFAYFAWPSPHMRRILVPFFPSIHSLGALQCAHTHIHPIFN